MASYGCDPARCAHRSDKVCGLTLGCLGTTSPPFAHPSLVLRDAPSLALLLCIAAALPEGPAPLTRHSSTQAASRTLPMLEDLDEGLTDEQEGILSFTALAMSINPRAQKHLSAAPTQPSSVIQRGGAVETLPQDSCSKG